MNITRPAKGLLKFMRNHPNLQEIRNNPILILQAMDVYSAKHEFLINIGPEKGRIVTDTIAQEQPGTIVEVGGYVGYSAILFADHMRRANPEAKLLSLEFNPQFAKIISEMVSLAGLQDSVTVVTGSADESMRRLKKEGQLGNIDLLFLDHVEDLYERDLKVAMDELGLLRSGASEYTYG